MRPDKLRICLLLILAVAPVLLAQTTGQIEGLVRDPKGMAVPGAAVRIVESDTKAERQLGTDAGGWYVAPALAPGGYEIQVSRDGFRREVREGVLLEAGRAARVDFLLQLGDLRDSLTVVGAAPPISTSPRDWGGSIERAKLESLPLNGRDLFDLASQQPGAFAVTTAAKSITIGFGARISVNGARPNQNGFRMDGIYINDATGAAPASATGKLLGLEAIQELHLVASPFDAEYGRAGGAVVTAVSKSGSNDWHGSAYEFLRNSALDAKNFFDPAGEAIPPLRRNQFGGLLSGPVRRDTLFFLVNYEGTRETSGQTTHSVVPTDSARSGQLPGRTVVVAPQVVPYLNLYPRPNGRDYGDGTAEYVTMAVNRSHENLLTGKVDVVATSRLRHATRYAFDEAATARPDPLVIWTFLDTSRYHFLHNETQFIQSPSTIHTFRAGFSRVWNMQTSRQPNYITPSMSFVPGQPMGNISMTAGLSNLGGATGASLAQLPRRYVVNDFQFNHALTSIRGPHVLRLGGAFNRFQFNQRADQSSKGFYSFSSLTDFLQARPRSGEIMLPGSDAVRGWRQNIYSAFVQDDLRAGEGFGITLGMRYEAYSTPTEVNGKIATIPGDLAQAKGMTTGVGLFHNPSKRNFAPRASLAFAPFHSRKTVLRAGAGIFYDLLSSRELVVAGARVPPYYLLAQPTNPSFPDLLAAVLSTPGANSLDMLDYYLQQPYLAQFQFIVERELPRDTVVRFGYVGSRGVHLLATLSEVNPNRPQVLPDGQLFFPEVLARLNPLFGRVRSRRTQFQSSYNALQASVEHRLRGSFRVQVKYAWSKSIDNASSVVTRDFANGDGVPTMFNYRLNRGPSDFDLRHIVASNFSWAVPSVGRGLADRFLGGWELNGLMQVQSGPSFNPSVGFDRARLTGGGSTDNQQRPMYIAAPGASIILGDPQQWFDPNAFGLPPAGMYGNLGRNTLRGPGLATMDLALHKILWRTERQNLRLRVEAFNLANHPNFQIPSSLGLFDSTLNRVGAAGRISQTTTTSRQIQLALKWVF